MIVYFDSKRLLALSLILLTVGYGHLTRQYGAILYTAPFYAVLAVAGGVGGLRLALTAATLFSFGAYLEWHASDPNRMWWNIVSLFIVAYMIGSLTRKARIVDNINGNLDLLWSIVRSLDYSIQHWPTLSDKSKYLRLREVRGMAGDLTTNILGWRHIAEAQKHVNTDNAEADSGQEEV